MSRTAPPKCADRGAVRRPARMCVWGGGAVVGAGPEFDRYWGVSFAPVALYAANDGNWNRLQNPAHCQ
jgi:hypothetical protein